MRAWLHGTMDSEDMVDWNNVVTIAIFLIAGYAALLTWIGRRQVNRIDSLERHIIDMRTAMSELKNDHSRDHVWLGEHERILDDLKDDMAEIKTKVNLIYETVVIRHKNGD